MDISFVLRKFRKSISGFTILALLATFVSFVGVAQASTFPDTDGHWGEAYIEALYDAGVVSGNDDGTFKPDNYLNRAELSKMLVLGYTEGLVDGAENTYPDVADGDWYSEYAASANSYGIMTGEGDGTFNGAAYVNRAVLMQAVYNAAGLSASEMELPFSDVMESDWFYDAVSAGYAWSIVDGKSETMYDPAGQATRAEASKVIYNGWYPVERDMEEDDEEEDEEDEEDTTSEGTLLMSLSADSPDGATLPSGATSVELVAFDATAEDDDVNIDSITFNHYGVSSLSSTHSAYVYYEMDGVQMRASSGQSINSSTHDVTFNNLDIEVEEGETVRVAVRLDTGTVSATGEVGIQIESADMIDADGADVSGSFPLKGDLFDLSTTAAGTVTIEKNGTVDNAQVGEDGAEIGKFKITAATEAAHLEELGLYISGSVDTDAVENFQLWVSGEDEAIAQVDNVDSLDVARFMIDDYEISKGATKSFTVTADFNTGRTSDTVKAYIDENTDVLAIGDLYGYGMTVTRTLYDGNADSCASSASVDCSYMSLEGGDVTISSNGPSASDVAINGDDVTIMEFDVVTVTDVTFKNFPISLTVTEAAAASGLLNGTTSNITDVKIVDLETGEEMFSSVDSDVFTTAIGGSTAIDDATANNDGAQAFHLYTDDWSPEAGTEYSFALMVDVENQSALAGDTIVATLELGTSYPEIRDVNNKVLTNSSVLVPASAITSKTHTLRSPSLTLSLASTPVSDTYVKGSDDVDFTGIVLACGDASTCRITDLTISGYLDDDSDGSFETSSTSTVDASDHSTALNSYVGSIWLEDADGNVVDGPESVNGTTFATTFTDIDWTLDDGETTILYVMGDINSDAYKNSDGEGIAFGISAASNITVEDQDGNSFSATGTVNASQSTVVTVSNGGVLTVAVDGSTPKEDIVVAGTTDQEVSVYNVSATDEAFIITDLSLNARQSGVTNALFADYDNNIVGVSVAYENSDGETETASGFISNGTAALTGLDIYVPADDDVNITVYVDANTIQNGATAAEFIELNMAFNNFEAIAQGSGETYKADKIDATTVATGAYLDMGTRTFTTTGVTLGTTDAGVVLGGSETIVTQDLNVSLPVGTLIMTDTDATYDATNSTIFVLTSKYTDGDLSFTGLVIDNADTTPATGDTVFYALPGSGTLTDTNSFHVYETVPTLALASSSPSGDRTVSSNDQPFIFTVSADSHEKVVVRGAQINDATAATTDFNASALDGTFTATDALSTVSTGGIGNSAFQRETSAGVNGAGIIYTFGAAADLSGYNGISFWVRASEAANTITLTIDDSAGTDQTVSSGAMTANTWQFVDLSFAGVASTDLDVISTLTWAITDDSAVSAATYDLDRIALYYEKITVDIAADTDIDTFTSGSADNLVAYLKNGSTTVATGYVYSSTQGADASSASVTFYPQAGTDSNIEVSKGNTKTYAVELSTSSLLAEDAGSDDPVSFSIDYGTSAARVVTPGDFWWYDTNATVKWLGETGSTSLQSNTLTY